MQIKLITFFISLVIFLFLFNIKVSAQQSYFLIPGVNCGIAGDIKTSKCCTPTKFEFFRPPDLGSPLKVMFDLVTGVAQNFLKGVVDPLNDLQKKMLIPCQTGVQSTSDPTDLNCRCEIAISPVPGPIAAFKKFCDNQTSAGDRTSCTSCISGGGVWTGLGCVQGSLSDFIGQTVFGWGVGLAGGFSLLCIIYAAFMMQSSQGNPEKLKKAQEMITSCIMGLMLIIFSVFILKLIGVNILKIPGFG